MTEEITLHVEDVSVVYKIVKGFSIKRNLLKGKRKRADEFTAVKHISFDAHEGEIIGVIGQNGSGKSTLLRAIAGIYRPNTGSIDLQGHSVSLMALGVGFATELSGRDNIMLSGMLLGFEKEEIRRRTKEIMEFAELGSFIDMPVRTYSSGMHSKLAFSIIAMMETDIMLVDEVLSVGDDRFRRKSLAKMEQLIRDKSRTVLIVSHNANTILEFCDTVLWIHQGEMVDLGKPQSVLRNYQEFMK